MTTLSIVPTHDRALRALTGLALAAALAFGVTACGNDGEGGSTTLADTAVTTEPVPSDGDEAASDVVETGTTVLSDEERAGLVYMVEEEKLAHDVYLTLGELWDVPTFANITQAETVHTASVQALLDRYGIPDPTDETAVGEFVDPGLAALYTELVAQGRTSLAEALAVGATIEELDIVDLDERSAQTDQADIAAVYANLRAGSENHLRAFVGALDARGVTYEATHLTEDAYAAVLAETTSQGRGRG